MGRYTYKIGKGRGTKTVQARQYERDQDYSLGQWCNARVYRDHFRIDTELGEVRASKGDWLVKYSEDDVRILNHREWTLTEPREVKYDDVD
jgi:hypothetical protein